VRADQCGNAREYLRELIRADQEAQARTRLRELIGDDWNSGSGRALMPQVAGQLKARALGRRR